MRGCVPNEGASGDSHTSPMLTFSYSLLVCQSAEDLRSQAAWDGARGHSRQHLLSELSSMTACFFSPAKTNTVCIASISPSVMIPDHRLAVLLDQAKQSQIAKCLYHSPTSRPSLFSDHMCDRSQFPLRTVLELSESVGEVWCIEFSHDGTMLAASGEDPSVIIYDTKTFQVRHKLADHDGYVAYVVWSPDDTKLITCSHDHIARVWDTAVRLLSLCSTCSLLNFHFRAVNVYSK